MKFGSNIKKFSAAMAATLALGSLSMGAFAAADPTLTIGEVTATFSGAQKLYSVSVPYTFANLPEDTQNPQITMLGYVFSGSEDDAKNYTVTQLEGKIRAIDQDAHGNYNGTITFGLAKGDSEEGYQVKKDSKLVIKLGTDLAGVSRQAYVFDLSGVETGPDGVIGDADGSGVVDGLDAVAVQEYDLYGTTLNRLDLANVNGDEGVDGLDAVAIQEYDLYGTPFAQ